MENIEEKILTKSKKKASVLPWVIIGLLFLGAISLYAGTKIFSNFSISADTDAPPVPPDPNSPTGEPPVPPEPTGPAIDVAIPAGWSMIAGSTLESRDLSPISKQGILLYSFNDPSPNLNTMDWIISNPANDVAADYFKISATQKLYPHPSVGYYLYNPGAAATLKLNKIASTRPDSNLIFGRGWHLMHWGGQASNKQQLLDSIKITYKDAGQLKLGEAVSDDKHTASVKIYVIVNQGSLENSSVKELSTSDSATTISKIPSNSFFWVYLRRTKLRATNLGSTLITSTPTATVTASASSDAPPTPPDPN